MDLNVKVAVTPRRLATLLRRDLKNASYLSEIEQSRKDMFAGRMTNWQDILDGEDRSNASKS